MIELPGSGQLQMAMAQQQMQAQAQAQQAQEAIHQFIAETASRIYAGLVVDVSAVMWASPELRSERLRELAGQSKLAATYLAESMGMIKLQE